MRNLMNREQRRSFLLKYAAKNAGKRDDKIAPYQPHWITIHGKDGKGVHIMVDNTGSILEGPQGMKGKNMKTLSTEEKTSFGSRAPARKATPEQIENAKRNDPFRPRPKPVPPPEPKPEPKPVPRPTPPPTLRQEPQPIQEQQAPQEPSITKEQRDAMVDKFLERHGLKPMEGADGGRYHEPELDDPGIYEEGGESQPFPENVLPTKMPQGVEYLKLCFCFRIALQSWGEKKEPGVIFAYFSIVRARSNVYCDSVPSGIRSQSSCAEIFSSQNAWDCKEIFSKRRRFT